MYIGLWVGDADACGVEFLFYALGDVPVDGPVIGGGGPWAADEIDGRIRKFVHVDGRFWLIENEFVFRDDALKDCLSFFGIIVVANTEHHIDTASGHACDIGNNFAPDFFVGDYDFLVIRGADNGTNEAYAIDGTGDATDFYGVSDIKGAIHDEHDSCGKISESVLQGESEDEGATADEGEGCSDVYTDSAESDDQADEKDDASAHLVDEDFEERGKVCLLLQGALNKLCREDGDEPEDDHDADELEGVHEPVDASFFGFHP